MNDPVVLTLETPGLVQPVLSTDQAELTHQALIALLNSPEESLSADPEEEQRVRSALSELVFFFSNVVDHPESFGVKTALETKRLLRAVKGTKGEAQPNKRKRRQRTRPSYERRSRRQKKAEAEEYNRAVKIMEEEAAEAEQANTDAMKAKIERFNGLLLKDTLSTEQVQELLELLGFQNIAEAAREMRKADSVEARILEAAAKRDANPEE